MNNIFADNLIYLRHKAGLSCSQVCEELDITTQRYNAWERGYCYPNMKMLIKICNYFDYKDIYTLITKHLKNA